MHLVRFRRKQLNCFFDFFSFFFLQLNSPASSAPNLGIIQQPVQQPVHQPMQQPQQPPVQQQQQQPIQSVPSSPTPKSVSPTPQLVQRPSSPIRQEPPKGFF